MAVSHTIQMLGLIGAASYLAARLARGSGRAAFHRYAIVAQPRAAFGHEDAFGVAKHAQPAGVDLRHHEGRAVAG